MAKAATATKATPAPAARTPADVANRETARSADQSVQRADQGPTAPRSTARDDAKQGEDGRADFGAGANSPTKDRAANESMQRKDPDFQPAVDGQKGLDLIGKAIDQLANTDRKSHDAPAIRDFRDGLKAALQRLEQFVSAP